MLSSITLTCFRGLFKAVVRIYSIGTVDARWETAGEIQAPEI
jgi:hypothetical protein